MTRRRTTVRAAAIAVAATASLLAPLLGAAAPAVATPRAATPGCADLQVSAHRGDPGRRVTENTLASFVRAQQRGARSIETDLRLTSDGVWVLMHDSTVDRTTRGRGQVATHSLAWLKSLRTDGGQQVPTLDETVEALPSDMGYQLEFKIRSASDAQLQRVVDTMRARGAAERTFLTSGNREMLSRLSVLAPDFQRGLIMPGDQRLAPSQVPSYVDSVNVHQRAATPAYIARMHTAGTQVLARSANSRAVWERLLTSQVDRIVTSDIAGYAAWCYRS